MDRKNENQINNFIWIQTSFLGDLVLTTAAMKLIKEKFPQSRQIFVTTNVGKKLFADQKIVDEVIVFEKRKASIRSFFDVRSQIAKLGCHKSNSVILQPHKSTRSGLLREILGFDAVTYWESSLSFLAKTRVFRVSPMSESARIGLLLEPFGVERKQILASRPHLDRLANDNFSNCNDAVGIVPGSVWGTKRWPSSSYFSLMRRILESGRSIVVLGSNSDGVHYDEIQKSFGNEEKILNLVGKTSISDLMSIVPRLSAVIANDSALIHFAAAYNVPTLAVFGPTVPQMGFYPQSENSVVSQVDLSCRPCGLHGHHHCPLQHFKCMNDISVDRVFADFKNLMA